MERHRIEGHWKHAKSKTRHRPDKPGDDEFEVTGRREPLVGKARERYAFAIESAEREIADWKRRGFS